MTAIHALEVHWPRVHFKCMYPLSVDPLSDGIHVQNALKCVSLLGSCKSLFNSVLVVPVTGTASWLTACLRVQGTISMSGLVSTVSGTNSPHFSNSAPFSGHILKLHPIVLSRRSRYDCRVSASLSQPLSSQSQAQISSTLDSNV